MLTNPFFNDSLKKYTALFGTLFNNIVIQKPGNNISQTIKVPISYSPKDKLLERLKADPSLDRPFKNQLPRMGFEMVSLEYDRNRKLTSTIKLSNTSANNTVYSAYMPVPYNVKYRLYVLVKSITDGTRIIEQILPFFTPDWTPTIQLIEDLDLKYDIPIVLDDVTMEDTFEGGFDEDRMIMWTLDFTLRGYLVGPVTDASDKVIKFAMVRTYLNTNTTSITSNTIVRPGLLANGSPTTDINLTIPYDQISVDDNWDYIVKTEYL